MRSVYLDMEWLRVRLKKKHWNFALYHKNDSSFLTASFDRGLINHFFLFFRGHSSISSAILEIFEFFFFLFFSSLLFLFCICSFPNFVIFPQFLNFQLLRKFQAFSVFSPFSSFRSFPSLVIFLLNSFFINCCQHCLGISFFLEWIIWYVMIPNICIFYGS